MKKTLITGGMGFIGSQIARRSVIEGDEVNILTRSCDKSRNITDILDKVKITKKDVREISEKDVDGVDIVYHLASTVDNYAIREGRPYEDLQINCEGTIALLEAMKKVNPEAPLLYASTFFVNGQVENLPVTKESPCNPLGLYGATRLAGENFCKVYNSVAGLNTKIARFTNVFGPHEQGTNKKKAAFNHLIYLAVKGEEIPVYKRDTSLGDESAGDFIRDYIYVDDVISACQTIAETGKKGETYYVGRGEKTKFKDLIEMIREEIPNTRIKVINPPVFHTQVGIKDFYCDNSDLRSLGWKPEVPLKEGIRRTISYYRNYSE